MVKQTAKKIYAECQVRGVSHYQCCSCSHRPFSNELKAAVHVYYHHPHLRQNTKPTKDAKPSAYLFGLLPPRKLEVFRKKVAAKRDFKPVASRQSPAKSASSSESAVRKSDRLQKALAKQNLITMQSNLMKWLNTGVLPD